MGKAKAWFIRSTTQRQSGSTDGTMLVPSVEQVRAAILAIPLGETRTILQMRRNLARDAGADITCPWMAKQVWYAVARSNDGPWWRITRDGKPDPRLPGGEEAHRARLAEEGVRLP